jgi:hypothetical protein
MLYRITTSRIAGLLWSFLLLPGSATGQLDDVLKAVQKIDPLSPTELHFKLGEDLPEGGHLQGVQWFSRESGTQDFLILSGSGDSFSYLVTVNLSDTNNKATMTKLLDSPFRHAGGFQVMDGHIAAIGLEDNRTKDVSRIWVIDMAATDPRKPLRPMIEIDRRGEVKRSTAGAVAITRIGDRYLLMVGTWDCATIDFYESNGHPLNDPRCRFQKGDTWSAALADRSGWSDPHFGSYQNINLITDKQGRCFLATFCREGEDDLLDLYELKMGGNTSTPRRLLKRRSIRFNCTKTSFRSGAGIRILKGGALSVYACSGRGDIVEWFK